MPELPEVETVRRTLEPVLLGRHIARVALARRDIVIGPSTPAAMLRDTRINSLERRGKQLAILASSAPASNTPAPPQRVLIVHLGMTGQLFHLPPGARTPRADHVHAVWTLQTADGQPAGRLLFRDPRRFGELVPLAGIDVLRERWSQTVGPDALAVTAAQLHAALGSSARAIKAGLLDQQALAGVGNIYADESLFAARIHPLAPCRSLSPDQWEILAACVRRTLAQALEQGGSTLRDFVSGVGEPGAYQRAHSVYGRAGEPCTVCGEALASDQVAQRTTVWCPRCQTCP